MLSYVFWHVAKGGGDPERYESDVARFHESLRSQPPGGLRGSRFYRIVSAPWVPAAERAYEDWYMLDGSAAIDEINEAAVGAVHRGAHDAAAKGAAWGAAGLYRLRLGSATVLPRRAIWISKPEGESYEEFSRRFTSQIGPFALWGRQMVLGPTPEFCLQVEAPSPLSLAPAAQVEIRRSWIFERKTGKRAEGDRSAVAPMQPGDWESIRRIYQEGLATGNSTFETEVPSWEEWDQKHYGHSRLVARRGPEVIGWAATSPVSARSCYAGVAEVSVYVAASERGRGIGTRLLEALIETSERNGIWTLCGAVIADNQASLRVQLAAGFRIVGRRERVARHQGRWKDTILTERRSTAAGID